MAHATVSIIAIDLHLEVEYCSLWYSWFIISTVLDLIVIDINISMSFTLELAIGLYEWVDRSYCVNETVTFFQSVSLNF